MLADAVSYLLSVAGIRAIGGASRPRRVLIHAGRGPATCSTAGATSWPTRRLAARFGWHPVLLAAGTLRACWLLGLAFVRPGAAGLVLVTVVQFGLVTCCGVFNPVLATHRLEQTTPDRVARTLAAWSASSSLSIAALTALRGALATAIGPRAAIGAAGVLILGTPLLLPRHGRPVAQSRPGPPPRPEQARDGRGRPEPPGAAPSPGTRKPRPISSPPLSWR